MEHNRAATSHIATRRTPPRGTVTIIVLWTIAVASLVVGSVQLFSMRQASFGREALQRVQARWAARAGIENTIAVMADYTETPDNEDAFAMARAMAYVADGDMDFAEYEIRYHADGADWRGPLDEHSRVNINAAQSDGAVLMQIFDDLTIDVVSAINDWQDEDDEVSGLGAERDWYLSLDSPYDPRNGPLRNVAEIELIAGVWPEYFRGEDWNMNNCLDENEDDADGSFPLDDGDGWLTEGWYARLTTHSRDYGATASGLPRIWLRDTTVEELQERLFVEPAQAQALINFARNEENKLWKLKSAPLGNIDRSGNITQQPQAQQPAEKGQQQGDGAGPGQPQQQQQPTTPPLTDEQYHAVLAETSLEHPLKRIPGRININTVSPELLRDLLEPDEILAEEIIYLRNSRPEGIVHFTQLLDIQDLTLEAWEDLAERFDTTSNVYTITSRGRSKASGIPVEIIVTVDRSTLPVQILEYREQ